MKYYKRIKDAKHSQNFNDYYKQGKIYEGSRKRPGASFMLQECDKEFVEEVPAGDYFVQENRLPECFRVKMIKHPLREKYVEWWKNEFNSKFYYEGELGKFYGFDSYNRTNMLNADINENLPENAVELTLEQWDKIVNKNVIEEEEITGYKLKEGCEHYRKAAEEIVGFYNPNNSEQLFKRHFKQENKGWFIDKLKEAGVLDLWFEPIYKVEIPDIEVGDYIYIIDACGANKEYFSEYSGDILKVISFKKENIILYPNAYWLKHTPESFSGGGFRVDKSAWEYGVHFRKATKEEILKHLQIEFTKRTGIDIDSEVTINTVENACYDSTFKKWDKSNLFHGNRKVITFDLIDDRLVVKVSNASPDIFVAVEVIQLKQKLTFGGNEVTLNKVTSGVRITCAGETGTLSQMEQIYDFITTFPTFKFGSQRLEKIEFPSINVHLDDLTEKPLNIKIGCTTGTWEEFCNILKAAKKLENE